MSNLPERIWAQVYGSGANTRIHACDVDPRTIHDNGKPVAEYIPADVANAEIKTLQGDLSINLQINMQLQELLESKDAEIERLKAELDNAKAWEAEAWEQASDNNLEIERLKAENAELRREIGGFPHLSDMRQCMIDTAEENERLKKVADLAIAYLQDKDPELVDEIKEEESVLAAYLKEKS